VARNNRSLKPTGTSAIIVDLGHLIRGKLIVLANPDEDPALLCLSGSGPRGTGIILTEFFYKYVIFLKLNV
jgi:hypothetical protein